jgi:predicted nucleotidyltransferase
MSLVENIKDKLNSALPDLQTRYPIAKLGIFGSVTRTDFTDKSDIDIMVEFNGEIGWEFFDLEEELTKMLGRNVDLVAAGAPKAHYLPYIQKDLIYV